MHPAGPADSAHSAGPADSARPANTQLAEDGLEYEYVSEEYYVVAALPPNTLAKARDTASHNLEALSRRRKKGKAPENEAEEHEQEEEDEEALVEDNADAENKDVCIRNSLFGKTRRRGARSKAPQYAIIDVDTERPMLEIEGDIFLGSQDELLGTHLLFDIDAENDDGTERTKADLVGATSRTIVFQPARITKNPTYKLPPHLI
ncbi:hypothetical protein LPJ66_010654 [Kickxella alabastrina]|uniref:Uncharacterized protein n=1 Tax=Kickxella alabastrina TaxID=61397 RepID=A0ACC1I2F5_9FUNG|nr:hypothetical protein LPJ66_010654 [Kickxella alabastrina]